MKRKKPKHTVEWLTEADVRCPPPFVHHYLGSHFRFRVDGKEYRTPKGTCVDGASIPRLFWRVVGPPMRGPYLGASIGHDGLCLGVLEVWENGKWQPFRLNWKDAAVFFRILLAGSPEVGRIQGPAMYAGVRLYGLWPGVETDNPET